MLKSLKTINLSAAQYNKILTIIAWAKVYNPLLIDREIIDTVLKRISEANRREKVHDFSTYKMDIALNHMPFPRWMIKTGFRQIFSNLPKSPTTLRVPHQLPLAIDEMAKTLDDYIIEEEKNSNFEKANNIIQADKMSIFKLSNHSSEEVILRTLARVWLLRNKYKQISVETKLRSKKTIARKLKLLLENPDRTSLDFCRSPALWRILLDCENTNHQISDCHLIGQKYVGWAKSFQMEYLEQIQKMKGCDGQLVDIVLGCREFGIRLRTLPEECAIFLS